jgi:hypothetical protein
VLVFVAAGTLWDGAAAGLDDPPPAFTAMTMIAIRARSPSAYQRFFLYQGASPSPWPWPPSPLPERISVRI